MQIQIIERVALQRRLLPLQRHHQIRDRAAEEAMRHRHRRRGGKGDRVERRDAFTAVPAQDLALIAARDHLIKAWPSFTLVVHPHIMLGNADQPRAGIDAAGCAEVLARGIARASHCRCCQCSRRAT